MTTILTTRELLATEQLDLGASAWLEIDQKRIDRFAEATGDFQWIHTDAERAGAGPFGATVAHGFLTLSILPVLLRDILDVPDKTMGVNYGLETVRFTNPVRCGDRIRAHGQLLSAERRGDGVLYRLAIQVEIRGSDRPALVAETLALAYPGPESAVDAVPGPSP